MNRTLKILALGATIPLVFLTPYFARGIKTGEWKPSKQEAVYAQKVAEEKAKYEQRVKFETETRQFPGPTHPWLGEICGESRFEARYEVVDFPKKGATTWFYDAGKRGFMRTGDGSLDYVKIYQNGENTFIGRKDPGFSQFEKMFDEQVKPAAKKLGREMN